MSLKLMIVDDSPDQRDLLRARFERIGCEVVAEARDAAEAVEMFLRLQPDLVTLDIIMSTQNGMDALGAFRVMRSEAPRTRIIIVSAVRKSKSAEMFMSEGAFALMEKPVTHAMFRTLHRKIAATFPEIRFSEFAVN